MNPPIENLKDLMMCEVCGYAHKRLVGIAAGVPLTKGDAITVCSVCGHLSLYDEHGRCVPMTVESHRMLTFDAVCLVRVRELQLLAARRLLDETNAEWQRRAAEGRPGT